MLQKYSLPQVLIVLLHLVSAIPKGTKYGTSFKIILNAVSIGTYKWTIVQSACEYSVFSVYRRLRSLFFDE